MTGPDGVAGSRLAPGDYLVCYYDANESATVSQTGEVVRPYLPLEPLFDDGPGQFGFICGQTDTFGEPFYGIVFSLGADETVLMEAPTFIYEGTMNIFVFKDTGAPGMSLLQESGQFPLAGVEVCIEQVVWEFIPLFPEEAGSNTILLGCEVSDENGLASFEIQFDYPYFNATIFGDQDDTFTTAGGAELYVPQYFFDPANFETDKSVFFTNQLTAYVNADGYELFCAYGGALTASPPTSSAAIE